jgi:tetratricopeptide (TPR) repeat protein
MAIIPLRAYNREIEGMVDNGQLDEAVAHCRHILATFPKHIATYRLLGKAHLEQQRISDATDIFQRVLSAIPDDFIANLGMSIIREDENNLDASIWHMELAYEAQPSNTAIQDELRRLYGRRDGMQPPKVRLTRGALARMYTKGGLLDQAVAELRAAISEDPNRYDLQLLLAGMYFQTSQRVEAIDTCINILKKLPYCLLANQILAVCLPETERAGTSKNYLQNAISMDPYFAYAVQDAITSDQVPDNSVNIERLEWKSSFQMGDAGAQPTWATALGVSMVTKPEEKLPEWLKGTEAPASTEPDEKAQSSVSPFIWENQEAEKIITDDKKPEDEIPDWMKDAGWKPASEETNQVPSEPIMEPPIVEGQPEEDLEKGDIPEWLRGIAPEGMLDEDLSSSQPNEKDVSLPWLEKHQPGPTDSIIQWLEDAKPETPIAAPEREVTPADMTDEEVPDWLKDLDVPYSTPAPDEQTPEKITAVPVIAAAFIGEKLTTEPSEPQGTNELPLVGSNVQIEKIEPLPEFPETLPAPEVLETEELSSVSAEEMPDWIKELAGEAPEPTTTAVTGEELKLELPSISEGQSVVEIPLAPEEKPIIELPVVANELRNEEPPALVSEQPIAEAVVPAAEQLPVVFPKVSVEELTASMPVVTSEQRATEDSTLADKQTPAEETGAVEGAKADFVPPTGENAALAWLAGLVIQESTKEEEQVTPNDEQEGTPTELVKLEAEATSEELLPGLQPQAEEAVAIPAEEIPDWLKGLGEISENEDIPKGAVSPTSPEEEPQPIEDLPAWLLGSEAQLDKKVAPGPTSETMEWKDEDIPDWIKEIADTTPSKEIPIEQPVSDEQFAALSEPAVELAPENILNPEVREIKTEESLESAWVPEVEAPVHPEITQTVEAGVESAAPVAEQLLVPSIEAPEIEITGIEDARKAIKQGEPAQAALVYTALVKHNHHLEDVINDVQEALYRFPVDVNLWVVLGDAYLRTDDLQEALKAYSKAEDLVR